MKSNNHTNSTYAKLLRILQHIDATVFCLIKIKFLFFYLNQLFDLNTYIYVLIHYS